jgi:hypothetical protein
MGSGKNFEYETFNPTYMFLTPESLIGSIAGCYAGGSERPR